MKTYISKSPEETKKIAFNLAEMVRKSHHKINVVALTGELGSGKTTFVQGFAKGLGIKEKIISPTFILIRSHEIPETNKALFHIDLYRLEEKDLDGVGINEIVNNPQNVVLIEWAEKMNYSAVNCGVSLRESSFRTIHPRSRAARYSGSKIKNLLSKETTWISFKTVSDIIREIKVESPS